MSALGADAGPRVALVDVDGTLVDTNYLHTMAWSRALRDSGEWAPMNAIHRLIGMGADQLLPRLIGRADEAISARRSERFAELIDESRAFPGAADLLRVLHEQGVIVVLATSAAQNELDHMVQLLGIEDVVDHVVTSDDMERSKPDPQIFACALEKAGAVAAEAVVIGDSVWDVAAANELGLRTIALESGGFSSGELAGATVVFRDAAQLAAHVRSHRLVGALQMRGMDGHD